MLVRPKQSDRVDCGLNCNDYFLYDPMPMITMITCA